MAVYATITDARLAYGDDYVVVSTDTDGDQLADEAAFARNLEDASARIDAYASDYFPDGLPATAAAAPSWWRRACIDIAIYFSSAEYGGGGGTAEKRQRYDDAIALLEAHYPAPEAEPTTPPSTSMEARIDTDAPERLFTRTTMQGLL